MDNLHGLVIHLSAQFQGYCRDLHTESVQAVNVALPSNLHVMFQLQAFAGRELDLSNARYESIRKDFERFGLDLAVELAVDPANAARITDINHLNSWRNYVAHQKSVPPVHGGPLSISTIQQWVRSCDGLAAALDRIMYNHLFNLTGLIPWI